MGGVVSRVGVVGREGQSRLLHSCESNYLVHKQHHAFFVLICFVAVLGLFYFAQNTSHRPHKLSANCLIYHHHSFYKTGLLFLSTCFVAFPSSTFLALSAKFSEQNPSSLL